ncbi:MAG TPA: zinc ribbon domain-containing protein [Ignavibacteriaceae bacterium]|mgnify:CR=1 FL=1|nr:zinc ribbon domain-containing protein [Ignavibacteriaceae bacterium]
MPIFEYKCNQCDTKFEILHKSVNNLEHVVCPECQSSDNRKLLSGFSASTGSSGDYNQGSCASGNCGINYSSPCASGMCGLN